MKVLLLMDLIMDMEQSLLPMVRNMKEDLVKENMIIEVKNKL